MGATLNISLIKREDAKEELAKFTHKGYGFVHKDATTCWSARAIWQNNRYSFDILHNRQSCSGSDPERKELVEWLNKEGLDLMHGAFLEYAFRTKTSDYVLIETDRFGMLASPNASFGYVYIGAWIKPEPDFSGV